MFSNEPGFNNSVKLLTEVYDLMSIWSLAERASVSRLGALGAKSKFYLNLEKFES